ncbi:hypothetical protein ANN_22531 [Periplaneta americana]|uniref:PiggyBac transposable element-derived protein domain-containing protein n=1 Tax=Periplaneta americana TaxID=6978 RepID=A0ABQ8S8E1_PERAM|nr:hypothetical protein ANN_22531 [Periplaneta americana]
MSTLHHVNQVSNRNDKKPQMILDYNASKGAVDTLDQVTYSTYTCKRKTNRWPVIFFYKILDASAYNAYVLWTSIDPNWNANKLTRRRLFLEELEKSLTKEHISSRKHFSRTEEAIRIVKNIQIPIIVTTVSVSESTRGKTVKRERWTIRKEIQVTPFIAILLDEASDVSNKSQLSTIIRYVSPSGHIQERFLRYTGVFPIFLYFTGHLYKILQTKHMDIEVCSKEVMGTSKLLSDMRNNFDYRYDRSVVMAGASRLPKKGQLFLTLQQIQHFPSVDSMSKFSTTLPCK